MPVQTQQSNLAAKLGGRISGAHELHKDKPVDTGNVQLPAGIRGGVAKLSTMYTKEYPDDKNGPGTKGQMFFRASAIVLSPEFHDGQKAAGGVTSIIIPLCDMPAKGQRKAVSFEDNWFEFQNLFKLLSKGTIVCAETKASDPTGQKAWAYYVGAMQALTDPKRPPVYVDFSTRGWTPPATPANPKPNEMVFETWHGLAVWNGVHNPAAAITAAQPDSMAPPPTGQTPPQTTPSILNPTPTAEPQEQFNEFQQEQTVVDLADVVQALVDVAMNDPEGATEDGRNASSKLEDMAWAGGWTKEQTAAAKDWAQIGDMCLNPPPTHPTQTNIAVVTVPSATPQQVAGTVVGAKHRFCKRTKDGSKLKDAAGKEFPPQDVEVVSVDSNGRTCTVKTTKDGKEVVDIRSKKPVAVKFEWLE